LHRASHIIGRRGDLVENMIAHGSVPHPFKYRPDVAGEVVDKHQDSIGSAIGTAPRQPSKDFLVVTPKTKLLGLYPAITFLF
jgi:hypothetical protein